MGRKRLSMSLDSYRAVLDGRKTVTRRVIGKTTLTRFLRLCSGHFGLDLTEDFIHVWREYAECADDELTQDARDFKAGLWRLSPYQPSDVVGLTCPHWRLNYLQDGPAIWDAVTRIQRFADGSRGEPVEPHINQCPILLPAREFWRRMPAFLMPRWACVHEVEIGSVGVEGLQDIGPGDMVAEGAPGVLVPTTDDGLRDMRDTGLRDWFHALWDSLNAARGHPWVDNPWVWRIEFKLLDTDGHG